MSADLVQRFYASLHDSKKYPVPKLIDSITESDKAVELERRKKDVMIKKYGGDRCKRCGSEMIVDIINTDRWGNLGKCYQSCKENYIWSHAFIFYHNQM